MIKKSSSFVILTALALFAPAAAGALQNHTVRKGDTLYELSRRFHVGVEDLKRANGLASDRLTPGAKLKVPRRDPKRAPPKVREPRPSRGGAPVQGAKECRLSDAKVETELQGVASQAPEEGEAPLGVTERLLQVAKKMLGIPYRFGGNCYRAIDCSAYVQKVFQFLNMPLPRTARQQYEEGMQVGMDELAKGDLIFFRTYARYPSHVGIYLGDNQFIHASSRGKKVTIDRLDIPFYLERFIGAKRVVQGEDAPGTEEPGSAEGGSG